MGVSKRSCPVCIALLERLTLGDANKEKFVVRGSHAVISACALPPWTPGPVVDMMIQAFGKILLPSRQMWTHPVVSLGIALIPQVQTRFPSTALVHTKQCPKTSVEHFKRNWRDINSYIPPLFQADCPPSLLIFIHFYLLIKSEDRPPCFLGIHNGLLLCIVNVILILM